ncbi:hypothetical protein [Palleronia pelagia]|uniref:Uncharacterized protein n=1 Tax=Palleronia pelagia TaxID=387096 RepID=A0A1H8KTY8_9RHOB|nr:hypothetical protein [Palleronia pelagia]SEN96353.1 hypothetical protein SAMN04488011_108144 [Palleronia pelagia]
MSWDLIVFAAGTPTTTGPSGAAHLPDDFEPTAIGTAAELRRVISDIFPATDWSNPGLGVLDRDGFSFEIALESDGPVTSFTIFTRGDATGAAGLLRDRTGWQMIETGGGSWLGEAQAAEAGRAKAADYLTDAAGRHRSSKGRSLFSRLFRR